MFKNVIQVIFRKKVGPMTLKHLTGIGSDPKPVTPLQPMRDCQGGRARSFRPQSTSANGR